MALALPFAAVLEVVDPTLPALDVVADVALLPAPDLTTSNCLFCTAFHVSNPYKDYVMAIRAYIP